MSVPFAVCCSALPLPGFCRSSSRQSPTIAAPTRSRIVANPRPNAHDIWLCAEVVVWGGAAAGGGVSRPAMGALVELLAAGGAVAVAGRGVTTTAWGAAWHATSVRAVATSTMRGDENICCIPPLY